MNFIQALRLAASVKRMTPLQEQVVKKGVCPRCHTKTLKLSVNGNGYRWQQCSKCGHAFVDGGPGESK